jgi:hypothetical protein
MLGASIGFPPGLAIGYWINRARHDRKAEQLSYAIPELLRRKGGALQNDLRWKRGLP